MTNIFNERSVIRFDDFRLNQNYALKSMKMISMIKHHYDDHNYDSI